MKEEYRMLFERKKSFQQALSDKKHTNQTLTGQVIHLQNELAN